MARRKRRRKAFGAGIHRPRVRIKGRSFKLLGRSPYKRRIRAVNRRRRNPVLAEYLLGNPRRRRRKNWGANRRHRYRRNPAEFGIKTLTNPLPLLTEAAAGLAGIYFPITLGNLAYNMVAPTVPALVQPGLVGSVVRAGVRGTVAWALDAFALNMVPMGPGGKNAYRVGAVIGIAGSFLMDLLGRPLILGPGDAALEPMYAFTGLTAAPATAGVNSYFRRGITGAVVPYPRVRGELSSYFRRGVSGAGATRMISPGTQSRLYS